MHPIKLSLTLAAALVLTGCQDLTVENLNAPDRARATAEPISTESFVATSFRTFWGVSGHNSRPAWLLATVADEVTSGFADFGQLEVSTIPRDAWNNSEVFQRRLSNEAPWFDLYRTISAVNDAIQAIDNGVVIGDATRTARAKAMGKFMQGLSHGYLGLYFDQAAIIDETVQLDTIRGAPDFAPYPEVIAAAVSQLDEAIGVAQATAISFPADGWLFTALTREQFIRLANSYAARLLAYAPRTRAERAAVDWNEVIRRVDAGIQEDFAPIAQPDILVDDWKRLTARLRTAGRPSDFGRPSYWLVGPADSTDGFVNWVNSEPASRAGFQMRTKDRRVQGAAGPDAPGTYVGYNRNNIFQVARGTYRFSWYYFVRFGTGLSWQTGPQPAVTVAELNLLKAEGLIRLGRAAEAVPLINQTRVANGQLPAVSVEGPPNEPGCVPRKQNGQCGSLWDALRYEKGIEGLGVSGVVRFFDMRGWQGLQQYTLTQFPIPGRELGTLRLPNYTFGGPGDNTSAPAPDVERCPVNLPRCG